MTSTSIQERLQLKREPLDKWSIREQLCLASAVARSGDQNWMSVSRALKPFGEPNRPADWFHQKNCAAQYGALLGNVETPKRKKRVSSVDTGVETPAECILKRLSAERQIELKKLLAEEKAEYQKLQEDMKLLQSGKVTEEQLDKWCKEIDDEELKSQQEALAHAQWLKQRDLRKQEIERAWRPIKHPYPVAGQKRKISDGLEEFVESEGDENSQFQQQQHYQQQHILQQSQQPQQIIHIPSQEPAKPALSPLLTSLLKSPSQVPNVSSVSTSILHNAITSQSSQKPMHHGSNANPTIASLLNSTAGVTVSRSLQQLVSTAIGQDGSGNLTADDQSQPLDTDILDDANLKIDDLANSILVQDGPLPEIKKEEVDDIISEIIENAQDIVADPDQHLQLDGNGDININLELDDLDEDVISPEETPTKEAKEMTKACDKLIAPQTPTVVDPFEFQEDPVLFQSPAKPSSMKQESSQYVPLYQQQSPAKVDDSNRKSIEKLDISPKTVSELDDKPLEDIKPKNLPGSVEIVEVGSEEDGHEKELNKSQIQDIVHSNKDNSDSLLIKEENLADEAQVKVKEETDNLIQLLEAKIEKSENVEDPDRQLEVKVEVDSNNANLELNDNTISSDLVDELYDNISMEVKIDKTGKTRRDYSRNKKKEEKSFDMLLAIEKAQVDDMEPVDDSIAEDKVDNDKKESKSRLKSENERSSSPWTEEEDNSTRGTKRRYSTPGTPSDSLPNSPASSNLCFDDDREYRNWKKSVMLVYNRLASNKYASLFLKPITDEHAPGYSSLVYRPMDLLTIKKNIDSGVIRMSLEFKRDVMLMFTNAIMYNKTNDTIYNMALQMQQESMDPIKILLQAQGQADAPLRRETRTSESNCKRKKVCDEIKVKKKKED